MNRTATQTVLVSVVAAIAAATGVAVQADTFYDNARVRSVEPQYEQVSVPREQCTSQWINETRRVDAEPVYVPNARQGGNNTNIGGLLIGGIAGGLLGNQVGKGSGRDAATAVGAVVGAMTGNHIANNNGSYNDGYNSGGRYVQAAPRYESVPRQVTQCQTVNEVQSRLTGYRVAYDWRGQTYSTVTREKPGASLQVRVSVDPVVR